MHITLLLLIKVSSIRTPMLVQGSLKRTEINLMHFKWEVMYCKSRTELSSC